VAGVRKDFFSEEKKQKTFISPLLLRAWSWADLDAAPGIKVFWFFSSEKNMLFSRREPASPKREAGYAAAIAS
jgi:hypothetical protein